MTGFPVMGLISAKAPVVTINKIVMPRVGPSKFHRLYPPMLVNESSIFSGRTLP